MEISFNFRSDGIAEEFGLPLRAATPEDRASQWLVAEIYADLSAEMNRRRIPLERQQQD